MNEPRDELYRDGLTIRDHFAGRAAQAIIGGLVGAHNYTPDMIAAKANKIAASAHAIAQAMLDEKAKRSGTRI